MDIVERLRGVDISWSQAGELCAEAADEIERLREIGLALLDALEDENPLAWSGTIRHAKRILNVE